jgi:diguanylate cyclase (GGDEF)-like protein
MLLLFLAWQINGMETEIHGLSLSDELTGLYNLRGFRLLADQALRLAQRANLPFSVLFIDLDNLKQINDSMGHTAGSVFLTETAEILRATFRETDVLGRIGGDEFAVAGQFSHAAISFAVKRLEERCAKRNAEAGRRIALSFSVGHVTTVEAHKETLDVLLAKADQVMYEAKRSKKEWQSRGELTGPHGGQGAQRA